MEKYLHKLQSQSWEEKEFVNSNDTQVKEKSQGLSPIGTQCGPMGLNAMYGGN